MHSLATEILALRASGAVEAEAGAQALALEQRRLFSVRQELLLALYGGVAVLVAGVGLLIRNNLERIGPATLLAGIGLAAAASYALALRRRPRSLAGDYLLLLGALLLGAAVGYAEQQFQLLGDRWSLYLLLLAIIHGAGAYAWHSRLLLTVAVTSFAAWSGVESQLGDIGSPTHAAFGAGWRSLALALLCLGARLSHERLRGGCGFAGVYEQFAVNFAFWGALALGFAPATRWFGALLLLVLSLVVARAGLRSRRESFVLYAIGYATFGLVALEAQLLRDPLLVSNLGLLTIAGAVVLLFRLRARLKESRG